MEGCIMSQRVSQIWNASYPMLKLSIVLLVALAIPHFFLQDTGLHPDGVTHHAAFKLGLEQLSPSLLHMIIYNKGKKNKIGLITNDTGKDQEGIYNIELLLEKGAKINCVFFPHEQTTHALKKVMQNPSKQIKIPLISWDLSHTQKNYLQQVKATDLFIFDMQDSGMKYGYSGLLFDVMKQAMMHKKKIMVFDRPNLLGVPLEGCMNPESLLSLPIRHGMTTGELAHYFNKYFFNDSINLQVVPMHNYYRGITSYEQTISGAFSPNIASLEACYGYSFLGLLGEVSPCDVGIGTEKSFQCITLPEKYAIKKSAWQGLAKILERHGIESVMYSYFNKRKKQQFHGLALTIANINEVQTMPTLLAILQFFKQEKIPLQFSKEFDHAVGTSLLREYIEGKIDKKQMHKEINAQAQLFFHRAAGSFMYTPLPQIVYV